MLGNSLIQNDSYSSLAFTHKSLIILKPVENCSIKIHHIYFKDFNVLFEAVNHWKIVISTPVHLFAKRGRRKRGPRIL